MAVTPSIQLTDAALSGGTITGSDISQAVAAAMVTKAAMRTVSARATDRINFADYSAADPSGESDNSPVINRALNDARAQGKALYFPAGV